MYQPLVSGGRGRWLDFENRRPLEEGEGVVEFLKVLHFEKEEMQVRGGVTYNSGIEVGNFDRGGGGGGRELAEF